MNIFTQGFLKLVGLLGGAAEHSSLVLFAEYEFAADLTGTDFVSLLNKPREAIAAVVRPLTDKDRMDRKRLSLQKITAASGEVAEEVHYFPNLRQGEYSDYSFLFRGSVLIGLNCTRHGPISERCGE